MKRCIVFNASLMIAVLCSSFAGARPALGESSAISAWGTGMATVSGSGDAEFFCNGFVAVNADTEVQVLEGAVEKIELTDGRIFYLSFDGKITASGQAMEITSGGSMYLLANCSGAVVLKGAGVYRSGFTWGLWRPQGVAVSIEKLK